MYAGPIGSVEVAELDWGNQQQAEALKPPFDYIIGTDVVRGSTYLKNCALHGSGMSWKLHVSSMYELCRQFHTQI